MKKETMLNIILNGLFILMEIFFINLVSDEFLRFHYMFLGFFIGMFTSFVIEYIHEKRMTPLNAKK